MKCLIVITLIFIASILSIQNAHALGIAPSTKIINYDTEDHNVTVRIINTEKSDRLIRITTEGELSPYVTLEENVIDMKSTDSEKSFRYTIRLPADISPGAKSAMIIATEEGTKQGDGGINSAISIVHRLQVNVPYNGTYAQGFLSTSETDGVSPITFTTSIINVGSDRIRQAYGKISIRRLDGSILVEDEAGKEYNITSGSNAKLEYAWSPDVPPGAYDVEYLVYYDAGDDKKILNLTKTFDIGRYDIDIINAEVKNFRLGSIAKIDINVSNNWNNPVPAYAQASILDKDDNIIRQTKTDTTPVNSRGDTIAAYIDTVGMSTGRYTLKIMLYYGSKTTENTYTSDISADAIRITPEGTDVQANIKENGGYVSMVVMLILAVLSIMWLLHNHTSTKDKNI